MFPADPGLVLLEGLLIVQRLLLGGLVADVIEIESIGQQDVVEWDILSLAGHPDKRILDVDSCNIVSEQSDFVGKELVPVLPFQILFVNDACLHQPGNKGPSSGERVEDIDILVVYINVELCLQSISSGMDDKINNLHRCVDHTVDGLVLREGIFEEFFV